MASEDNRWSALTMEERGGTPVLAPHLAVVIPTWQAAQDLPECLAALRASPWPGILSVIVADGGSEDGTRDLAERAGVIGIESPKGRGRQLAAGAAYACGRGADWLFFVHADSRLPRAWPQEVLRFIVETRQQRAGYLGLSYYGVCGWDKVWAGALTFWVGQRSRIFGLPYGDQGLLLSASFYRRLGGYPPWPLMEDVAFVRAIGRRRLHPLALKIATSPRRYQRGGWLRQSFKNAFLLFLYFLGVDPEVLHRLYGRGSEHERSR